MIARAAIEAGVGQFAFKGFIFELGQAGRLMMDGFAFIGLRI